MIALFCARESLAVVCTLSGVVCTLSGERDIVQISDRGRGVAGIIKFPQTADSIWHGWIVARNIPDIISSPSPIDASFIAEHALMVSLPLGRNMVLMYYYNLIL